MSAKFYAVKNGRMKGVFLTWPECEAQVKGFPGAEYKSFKNIVEAQAYLSATPVAPVAPATPVVPVVAPTPVSAPTEKPAFPTMPNHMNQTNANRFDAYVDGSFDGTNYGWGFAIYYNGQLIHSDCGVGTNADAVSLRNVAGELAATLRAVRWAVKNNRQIVIHHDYVGISAWVNGEWKAKNDLTQKYVAYMNKYRNVFTFNKVKGHSGNLGNNTADKLARKALGI